MRQYPNKGPKYRVHPDPHLLVAFDLGKWKVGSAVSLVDPAAGMTRLIGAETHVLPKKDNKEWDAKDMAAVVAEAIPLASTMMIPIIFVCEWPMKYKDKRSKHKDIETLHKVGYALETALDMRFAERYLPGQWKGNVPKPAHRRRIVRELTPSERTLLYAHLAAEVFDKDATKARAWADSAAAHDMWDAIGINLFATGRTRRGGTRS